MLHTIVSCYAHLPFLSSSFELIAAYREKSTFCPDSRSEFRNLCRYRQHEQFTVVELFKTTESWGGGGGVQFAITSPVPYLS